MTIKIELEAAVYRAHKVWEDRLNYWTDEISHSGSVEKLSETEDAADKDMVSYTKALEDARKQLEEFEAGVE